MNKDKQKEQLENESAFAATCKQVLNNQAYKQFLLERKTQIFDIFCNTTKDQGDVREEAWRTMKNLRAMEKYFEHMIETGNMADTTLELHKED